MIPVSVFTILKPAGQTENISVNLTGQGGVMGIGTPTVDVGTDILHFVASSFSGGANHLIWEVDGLEDDWRQEDSGSKFPVFGTQVPSAAVSPDGRFYAYLSNQSPYVIVMDLSDWSVVSTGISDFSSTPISVSFSHDSSLMSVTRGPSPDIFIYNTSDWSTQATVTNANAQVGVFSPTDDYFALSLTASPWIHVYDTNTWTRLVTEPLPGAAVHTESIQFSSQGSYLAIGMNSAPYLKVFNSGTWTNVSLATSFSNIVEGIKFSNDETLMACGGAFGTDDTVRILNVPGWDSVSITQPTDSVRVTNFAWKADDSVLAALGTGDTVATSITMYDTSDWTTHYPVDGMVNADNGHFLTAPLIPQNDSANLTGQSTNVTRGNLGVTAQRFVTVNINGQQVNSSQGSLLFGIDRTSDAYWIPFNDETWTGTEWTQWTVAPFLELAVLGAWTAGLRPTKVSFTVAGSTMPWDALVAGATQNENSGAVTGPLAEVATDSITEDIIEIGLSFDPADHMTATLTKIEFTF